MKNSKIAVCPVCETKVGVENPKEVYVSLYNNQEYKLYECPSCQLQWWEPLKIIPEFYESEVFEDYVSFHEGVRSRIGQNHKAFFEYFPKEVKGGLLDIGCGDGVFLREDQKHGFEVWGIDFDKKSIETAKKSLGVDTLYAMSLEEFYHFAKEKGLKFEVITFFEVLEHQDKPREFLKMVKDLLVDGGYIVGSVPNRERLFADVDWKYFHGDHPPHHFLRFSKEALENTLKIVGFSDVKVYRPDFPKEELPAYVEKKLLGKGLDKLKIWLKGKAFDNPRLAKAVTVEDLSQINPSFSSQFLKFLKRLRTFFFLPFSLPYLPKLKSRNPSLFSGKGFKMRKNYNISVIMSTYKEPLEYVQKAVESILNQTYKDFEFLIAIDDPENIEMIELLNEYAKLDDRIKIYVNPGNLGPANSRNRLIKLSRGEFIAIMDADDYSFPERIEKQIKLYA